MEVTFEVDLEALQRRRCSSGRKMMRYRNYRFFGPGFGFSFGFPPFGLHLRGRRGFLKREEYLRMLKEYKQELEEELRGVETEIGEWKKEIS